MNKVDFDTPILEKVYEKLEEYANKYLLIIANSDIQNNELAYTRGCRKSLLDAMDYIKELDKLQSYEV